MSSAHAGRGARHAGRRSRSSGEARTALGFLYREIGPQAFFARLGELGDGMLFDTRVLFAHLGWRRRRRIASRPISSARTRSRTASCASSPRSRARRRSRCFSVDTPSSRASSGRSSRPHGPVIPSLDPAALRSPHPHRALRRHGLARRSRAHRVGAPARRVGSFSLAREAAGRRRRAALHRRRRAAWTARRTRVRPRRRAAAPLDDARVAALHDRRAAPARGRRGMDPGSTTRARSSREESPTFAERDRFGDSALARRIRERMLEVVRHGFEHDGIDILGHGTMSPARGARRSGGACTPSSGRSSSSSCASTPTSRSR